MIAYRGRLVLLYVFLVYIVYSHSYVAVYPRRNLQLHVSECARPTHIFSVKKNTNIQSNESSERKDTSVIELVRGSSSPFVLSTMFAVSGPLGMMLDNYHGLFGVLHYNDLGYPFTLTIGDSTILKTALWVPFLFGFAGFAMSLIGLALDALTQTSEDVRRPAWHKTFYSISLFSFQYYLSGYLDNIHVGNLIIHIALAILAVGGFKVFDGSYAGLLLALATAVAGPLTEIVLINGFHLYYYTNSDWLGICSWIPWVYFLGAPAVLNLARSIRQIDTRVAER